MTNLRHASWFQAPDVQQVFAALGADMVRLVGGCVRDALLGRPVGDVDMACVQAPKTVMAQLKKSGIRVIPTGIAHGTVRAQFADRHIEITSLRRDVRTDGRRAKVEFGGSWDSDAQRRDFTINALYVTADGDVQDPLGQGLADIKAQRVRFIGAPQQRIREDYLRIIRFFRMRALLDKPKTDRAALAACRQHIRGLRHLSAERVQSEIWKLLLLPHCAPAISAMARAAVLDALLPRDWGKQVGRKGVSVTRLRALTAIDSAQFFAPDALLRLAALLPNVSAAGALARHWKLSKKHMQYLTDVLAPGPALVCYLSARDARRLLYMQGVEIFKARVRLAWAQDVRARNAIQWRALLAIADSWHRPVLPLNGDMMRAAGVPEGPDMSRIQKEVERWWIDSDFTSDTFSIIERLKAIVQATIY